MHTIWLDGNQVQQLLRAKDAHATQLPGRNPDRNAVTTSVAKPVKTQVVLFSALIYESGVGDEIPYTGIAVQYYRTGELQDLVHYVDGLADGISVARYANGQIEIYNEVSGGVRGVAKRWWLACIQMEAICEKQARTHFILCD